jgi:hypothetical protein
VVQNPEQQQQQQQQQVHGERLQEAQQQQGLERDQDLSMLQQQDTPQAGPCKARQVESQQSQAQPALPRSGREVKSSRSSSKQSSSKRRSSNTRRSLPLGMHAATTWEGLLYRLNSPEAFQDPTSALAVLHDFKQQQQQHHHHQGSHLIKGQDPDAYELDGKGSSSDPSATPPESDIGVRRNRNSDASSGSGSRPSNRGNQEMDPGVVVHVLNQAAKLATEQVAARGSTSLDWDHLVVSWLLKPVSCHSCIWHFN